MIRYHGGPITPNIAARDVWTTRHACVSFERLDQIELAAEVAHSFILDNGAFTAWTQKREYNFEGYAEVVRTWMQHPAFDWCLIPDTIDGDEDDNNDLRERWHKQGFSPWYSVPVWHMHETLSQLELLTNNYPRIALGSSGEFSKPGTDPWWRRMCEAMDVLCRDGKPIRKLHGLRMMNPTIFSHVPFASVDSTNVAQNVASEIRWSGPYAPASKAMRGLVLADRVERHASAATWSGSKGVQMNFELAG